MTATFVGESTIVFECGWCRRFPPGNQHVGSRIMLCQYCLGRMLDCPGFIIVRASIVPLIVERGLSFVVGVNTPSTEGVFFVCPFEPLTVVVSSRSWWSLERGESMSNGNVVVVT